MLSPTVNSIIKDNYDRYISQYPYTTKAEKKILSLLSRCRTGDLGYRVEQCDTCGHRVILNNSCRNRHCPLCQNMKKEQWIIERKKEVLPFTYFHIVFTLPDKLNSLIWRNKRILYNLLFSIAKETLLSVSADEKYFGADIGFFSVLHTWGQKLNLHPHVHCVVPGGGYSKKKQQWKHAPGNYFVPVQVLKNRFRSRFLVALKKLYLNGSLYCEGTVYSDKKKFQQLINRLFELEWVVYLKESFSDSNSVIEYLGRYTHKIAISNHRIIYATHDSVSFSYRDYKDDNKKKIMSLDSLKFMKRFCLHILPFRFVRIRYYGLLVPSPCELLLIKKTNLALLLVFSVLLALVPKQLVKNHPVSALAHRNKADAVATCREFYGQITDNFSQNLTWQDVYLNKTGKDVRECPVCESGPEHPIKFHYIVFAQAASFNSKCIFQKTEKIHSLTLYEI